MNLLIDIGNTATKFAVSDKGDFRYVGRVYNFDINKENINSLLKEIKTISNIYVCSVAPKIFDSLQEILKDLYKIESKLVDISYNKYVDIKIDDPKELGMDLLCDLVAGKKLYGNKLAIVDYGTATKILFIDKDGVFSSCAIFLGVKQSKKKLSDKAELIPLVDEIKLKPISECHNTVDVINSSAIYSQLFTVKGIIAQYEQEVGYKVKVISTGGNATDFLKEKENHDRDLVLKGLLILTEGE